MLTGDLSLSNEGKIIKTKYENHVLYIDYEKLICIIRILLQDHH